MAATASMPGAGFSAVAPDMNRNDPPASSFAAKCLASSNGPVALVANEAFTRLAVSSAKPPLARADAVDTTWSTVAIRPASAAMEDSSVTSTRSMPVSVPRYAPARSSG